MNVSTALTVRAESYCMEFLAQFGFVLRVSGPGSQFVVSVSKLAFDTVTTPSILFKISAKFCFVVARLDTFLGIFVE